MTTRKAARRARVRSCDTGVRHGHHRRHGVEHRHRRPDPRCWPQLVDGRHDLTADNLLSADIVTVDGNFQTAAPTPTPTCSGRCAVVGTTPESSSPSNTFGVAVVRLPRSTDLEGVTFSAGPAYADATRDDHPVRYRVAEARSDSRYVPGPPHANARDAMSGNARPVPLRTRAGNMWDKCRSPTPERSERDVRIAPSDTTRLEPGWASDR
jgi:hypothetical protein